MVISTKITKGKKVELRGRLVEESGEEKKEKCCFPRYTKEAALHKV